MSVVQRIIRNGDLFPTKIAFKSRLGEITYKQLVLQSAALASWITKYNGKNSSIMIYGHMEPEMLVCFLASVRAGYTYIPVDESVPVERVSCILENENVSLIVALSSFPLQVDPKMVQVVEKEELSFILQSQKTVNECFEVRGEDIFYTMYTSGSTGNPKGVQVSVACLDSFVDWMVTDFPLGAERVFLNQAPFSFDLSVMDLYPALVSGGTIVAVDKGLLGSFRDLFLYLKESKLEVWTSTPSFVELCLMNAEFNGEEYPTLETFLFCGEILPRETARKLIQRFPNARVFNTYGPTEATVAVTGIEITEEVIDEFITLPLGLCKKDCKLLIIDRDGVPVPNGEKGEIIIVGPSVSVGYANDVEKTKDSFFEINGMRAYRTGDCGSLQDELLFYYGRLDFQIKLHGYRIELEDVENNLRRIPFVQSAVVIPVVKNEKCDYLKAILVVEEHEFKKEYELTSYLKKELSAYMPSYMIPRKFVYCTEIPMTSNGKVDRKKLTQEVYL